MTSGSQWTRVCELLGDEHDISFAEIDETDGDYKEYLALPHSMPRELIDAIVTLLHKLADCAR